MTTLFDQTLSFFENQSLEIDVSQKFQCLRAQVQGQRGIYNYYCHVIPNGNKLVFYVVFPVQLDEAQFCEMALLLAYANSRVILGNYEIDFEERELRYKTSAVIETDQTVSDLFMKEMIGTGVTMIDKLYPAAMGVLHTDMTAEDAFTFMNKNSELAKKASVAA